jgi:chromosome segregation ATPase
MESNDKFFNAYVDLAIGTLHQNINTILEIKTQVKLLEDLVREKDQVISALDGTIGALNEEKKSGLSDIDRLYTEKEQIRVDLEKKIDIVNKENESLKEKLKLVEDKYEMIQQKSTHMSTYESQIKDMKKEILAKNEEIEKLKNPVNKLDINISTKIDTKKIQKKAEAIDDF